MRTVREARNDSSQSIDDEESSVTSTDIDVEVEVEIPMLSRSGRCAHAFEIDQYHRSNPSLKLLLVISSKNLFELISVQLVRLCYL